MKEMGTAPYSLGSAVIRGDDLCFQLQLGSDGKFQGGEPASLSMDTSSDSALPLRNRQCLSAFFRDPSAVEGRDCLLCSASAIAVFFEKNVLVVMTGKGNIQRSIHL